MARIRPQTGVYSGITKVRLSGSANGFSGVARVKTAKGDTSMSTRVLALPTLVLSVFYSVSLIGQQTPASAVATSAEEFPVVSMGDAPADACWTQDSGKVWNATLVNGTVVPRNAALSGEVVALSAKPNRSFCLPFEWTQFNGRADPLP